MYKGGTLPLRKDPPVYAGTLRRTREGLRWTRTLTVYSTDSKTILVTLEIFYILYNYFLYFKWSGFILFFPGGESLYFLLDIFAFYL